MQNIAEFRIIGRIGKINTMEKVTYLDIASNYARKEGEAWKDDTHWNRVTLFGRAKERADKLSTGDLVHITGRIRQSRYERFSRLDGVGGGAAAAYSVAEAAGAAENCAGVAVWWQL